MFINEYGNRNDPTVILLAPMMISGSDLYGQMSQFFQGSYHIIAPDQGGHGRAGAYISADEEYRTMKSFLLETCCTNIELVYGASMGVAVAYRLFMDPEFTVNHAWFDGVALKNSAGFAEWLVSRMFRKRKKLSAKLKGKPSSMLVKMYGDDLDFGEKDFDLKLSRKAIPVYMPKAELTIRPGYQHCGYMAAHPKEYVEEIEQFIGRSV